MDRIVQITCLGKKGRFGNQLFQYAFARGYAERHNAILETPPWIGQELFDLDDRLPSRKLPRTAEDDIPPDGQVNVDLFGYFIWSGNLRRQPWTVANVRQWFAFTRGAMARFPVPCGDYVAVHLRRGDFKKYLKRTCIIRRAAYERALREHGFDPRQAIWVSEESGNPMPQDFLTLVRAKTLFMSNSTFSYWAGLLGGQRCFAPLCEDRTGWIDCDFAEGHRYIRKWTRKPSPK